MLVDLGDLRLRDWQSLGDILVFRVVRVEDLDQVLLTTHSWLPALFLLLYRYGSPSTTTLVSCCSHSSTH